MEIDKSKILNGTAQKRFDNSRAELMSDYTESNANDFYYSYCNQPISFILKNSRNIFSEAYFGLPFYKKLITGCNINPVSYESELSKINSFIDEAKKKGMPQTQLSLYEDLKSILENICENKSNIIHVFKKAMLNKNSEEYFNEFFDMVHDGDIDEYDLDDISKVVFDSSLDPYISIPTGFIFCKKYPKYCNLLSHLSRYHSRHLDDDSEDIVRRSFRTKECIREMMKDASISKDCAGFPNSNIYLEWAKLMNEPHDIEMNKKTSLPTIESPVIPDAVSVVESVFETVGDVDIKEKLQGSKYDVISKKLNTYKAYAESLEEDEILGNKKASLILEDVNNIIDELESQVMWLEWEDDGSPNSVIQKQIMTQKDREEKSKDKEKEIETKMSDDDSGDEFDALQKIDEASSKINDLAKKEKTKDSFLKKSANIKKELVDDIRTEIVHYPSVKNGLKKMDESIDDFTSIYEDGDEAPKEDVATKIQNKALDHEAKMTKKDAERKAKFQKIKNAANAISQRPKKELKDADKMVVDFDKWDDNRRKEFLLKPGNRHRLFKKLKLAILYGSVASMKFSYLPIAFMCRHLSKQKDKRIRNELQMELDSEIKICEEKISDASSAGDTKNKYQLMRIRDKLKAEKQRVELNSKYV